MEQSKIFWEAVGRHPNSLANGSENDLGGCYCLYVNVTVKEDE
jgi:hypothetical protein